MRSLQSYFSGRPWDFFYVLRHCVAWQPLAKRLYEIASALGVDVEVSRTLDWIELVQIVR